MKLELPVALRFLRVLDEERVLRRLATVKKHMNALLLKIYIKHTKYICVYIFFGFVLFVVLMLNVCSVH